MTVLQRCKALRAHIETRNELKRAHKEAEAFAGTVRRTEVTKAQITNDLEKLGTPAKTGSYSEATFTGRLVRAFERDLKSLETTLPTWAKVSV